MLLFAVRVREDKQAVGIFWTDALDNLWHLVEGVSDPNHCEYRAITGPAALVRDVVDVYRLAKTVLKRLLRLEAMDEDRCWKPVPYFDRPGASRDGT